MSGNLRDELRQKYVDIDGNFQVCFSSALNSGEHELMKSLWA